MPDQALLTLLAIAVFADLALIAVSPGPIGERVRRAGRRVAATVPARTGSRATAARDHADPMAGDGTLDLDLRPAALERVIRVATWVFLLAATTLVAVTDLWAERQGPILMLLAVAALYAVVLHHAVSRRISEGVILVGEGVLGLAFAGLLVALTGGATSPFFVAFPLIVGGAAIVVTPGATLGLTAAAGAAYLAAIVATGPDTLTAASVATAGANLTALCLLAYIAMAVGREQRRAREDAVERATVDALTGLRTRAFLFGALEREISRSERTGRRFCLLMIDLDDLKGINDRHGHLEGDRALRLVGDVVRAGTRRIDTGARFGGDEFLVLLPETDPTGGWVLAEKIRREIADAELVVGGAPVRVSVSVGLVAYPDDGATTRELLERADDAMYHSKRLGRDRVTGVPVTGVPVMDQVQDVAAHGGSDPGGRPAGVERRSV